MARTTNYLPTNKKNNYIRMDVYYNLGGINYFTYKNEPRGYWLSARLVERSEWNGCTSESYSLFGNGCRVFLKEVKRQSKKAEAEALTIAETYKKRLIESVLNECGLTLA